MKKKSIEAVLSELNFSDDEKKAFVECIKSVKKEQQDDSNKAEDEIKKIVEEVAKNEIS